MDPGQLTFSPNWNTTSASAPAPVTGVPSKPSPKKAKKKTTKVSVRSKAELVELPVHFRLDFRIIIKLLTLDHHPIHHHPIPLYLVVGTCFICCNFFLGEQGGARLHLFWDYGWRRVLRSLERSNLGHVLVRRLTHRRPSHRCLTGTCIRFPGRR